jgi:hypothetical protein
MAGSFAYLSSLTGDSELYQGDAGVQVLQKMRAGFERATSFGGVNDILTYRAAQSALARMSPEERAKYFDVDGGGQDIVHGDRYIDASLFIEEMTHKEAQDEYIEASKSENSDGAMQAYNRMEIAQPK